MSAGTEEDDITFGDIVEHKMNTNVFGVVIGFQGSLVGIQVSPTLEILWFHDFTLRKLPDDDEFDGGKEHPIDDSNVIDFTRAVDLRKAKAKGAA